MLNYTKIWGKNKMEIDDVPISQLRNRAAGHENIITQLHGL